MSPVGVGRARKIVILCEGDTEELAVRHFIRRQWENDGFRSVALQAVNLGGRVQDGPVKASLYLDSEEVLGAFTLIDLYGMDRVVHLPEDSLDTKTMRARTWLSDRLDHSRGLDFFPHVAVHETEAWILAEGEALARRLSDAHIQPDPQAESKNLTEPPSQRLNELFLSRKRNRYQKLLDGRPLFAALRFQPVYDTCKYFRGFYDDLKSVGSR